MMVDYDPQRLLTDQRLIHDKLRMAFYKDVKLGEPYVPDFGRMMAKPLKMEPLIIGADFGQTEARVLRHYAKGSFPVFVTGFEQIRDALDKATLSIKHYDKVMRLHTARIRDQQDRRIFEAMFGEPYDGPERSYARERRIAKLLRSRDRRQRKRGLRLFRQWDRTRPGFNFTPTGRYRK